MQPRHPSMACRNENIAAAAAYPKLDQVHPSPICESCATNISLIFPSVRFLFLAVTSTFVQNLLQSLRDLSPRVVIPSVHSFSKALRTLPDTCKRTLFFTSETLALPTHLTHQLGCSNLPPRKESESIYFRSTAVAALIPLWFVAFTTTMVMMMFGTVFNLLGRTVKQIFHRKPKSTEWQQIDVERGADWRPETATTGSDGDPAMDVPNTWSSSQEWEDLRRGQAALAQEKEIFDAAKAAWELDVAQQEEEKRSLDEGRQQLQSDKSSLERERQYFLEEKQQLQDEKAAFQQQQQKWKADLEVGAAAKAEIEAILRSFIEKSRRSGEVIAQLRKRVEMLPKAHRDGDMMGNPTPPASPKLTEKVILPVCPPPSKRKPSIRAAITA